MTPVDKKLLEILVCPLTKTALTHQGDELISKAASLAFPIRNGIPIMLIDEARKLDTNTPFPLKKKGKIDGQKHSA